MYGGHVKRGEARGKGQIADANVLKLGIVGTFERGLAAIKKEIYSKEDFRQKCGRVDTTNMSAHVYGDFNTSLESGVEVETKVAQFVASDAVQATIPIMDGAGTPVKIFDLAAGYKGAIDKSAFGNELAYKITHSYNNTYKLTANTAATPEIAYLDSVEGLKVGYGFRIADGSATEYAEITAIDTVAKTISFDALTATFTAAITTVSRMDWNLFLALKSLDGVYEQVESWENVPFIQSDSYGMPLLTNDETSGSWVVTLEVNAANSTATMDTQIPAVVSTWTALASGANGTPAVAADYATLVTDLDDENIMILLAPELSSATHNENMVDWATYKCMYYSQSSNGATEATLKNLGALLRGPVKFGMIPADKWKEVDNDADRGSKISIPVVGMAAAEWFNSYVANGAAKVSAGTKPVKTTGKLDLSNGLVHNDKDGKGGRLIREYSINICTFTLGKGITLNSGRTLSTDDGYKYQNQIMQWLLYSKSFITFLESIEQDKSGVSAQKSHYNQAFAYMKKKWDAGDFYQHQFKDGSLSKFEDVVIIVNDFSLNTLAEINAGRETMFMQFIGIPPIEEPILSLASAPVTFVRG